MMKSATDNAQTPGPAFAEHPHLRSADLPLTVAGIQTLFADIISEIAAVHHGLIDTDVSIRTLVDYAESRLPRVYGRDAATRGAGIAAIQSAVEHVEGTALPEGGATWPLNPIWLSDIINKVVTPLVAAWAHLNVPIPGATDLLRRVERTSLPKVMANIDDSGEHHARTGFLPVPDSPREAQYAIHRRDGQVYFARRFRGSRDFEDLAQIPHEATWAFLALMNWYRDTFQSPY